LVQKVFAFFFQKGANSRKNFFLLENALFCPENRPKNEDLFLENALFIQKIDAKNAEDLFWRAYFFD